MKWTACAALATVAALGVAPCAQTAPRATYVSLPSPVAQLSTTPPLGGGATATSEGIRHQINAATSVDVALDPSGAPFAVVATQRLDVRLAGDYFFTIGAPVLDVEAAPGSASTPGLRATSILWAGFNPGRRTLAARATLDPAVAGPALPMRIELAPGRVTLVNATVVTAGSYSAETLVAPLLRYFTQLKHDVALGRTPASGGAYITTKPVAVGVRVAVPLLVRGTVGGHKVDAVLGRRLEIRGSGPVRLTVTPTVPTELLRAPTTGLSGRQLLARITRITLTLARLRQYQTFLGNPDPSGPNAATYLYRTAFRPTPPTAAAVHQASRDWAATLAIVAGLLIAGLAAAFAWSRS